MRKKVILLIPLTFNNGKLVPQEILHGPGTMSKPSELLREAEQIAQTVSNWADLSNALYDPIDGLLAKAYPTREDRLAFIRTDEYKHIQLLLSQAMERFGRITGAKPTRVSGFMVPLPQGWSSTEPEAAAK